MSDKKYRVVNREPKSGDLIRLKNNGFYSGVQPGEVYPVSRVRTNADGSVSVYISGKSLPADFNDRYEYVFICGDECEVVEEVETPQVIVETACVKVNVKHPQDADPDLQKWMREKLAEHSATDKKCRDYIDAYTNALNEKAAELLEQYEAEKTEKEMAKQSRVVILSDGKTTTAKLYVGRKQVQEAKAVCSSEDAFNFFEGVCLAVNRLAEQTPEAENK